MATEIHSILCITPPHMLEQIAERGSTRQREWALRTLSTSEQFRGQRIAATSIRAMVQAAQAPEKERLVYDADHNTALPGRLVRSEGDPATGDAAVDEAYDGSGATYDLYKEQYDRNSIDNQGMHLVSTVHYQVGYDNAFWNGNQMVYGDGDEDLPEEERLFNRFTISLDVIGHELTHGVTQYEAGLMYVDQSGALNESLSDVFGSLVKQRTLGQTASEADWLIGAELLTPNVNGQALRSMKEPGTAYDDPLLGKDPQPGHMDDYVETGADNGGVHINSGIPNRAFYIAALEIGGHAWEKAGQIWYVALRDKLQVRSDFRDAANQTIQAAGELYGAGSLEQQAVQKGWKEVGVLDGNGTEPGGCSRILQALLGPSQSK